MRVVPASFAQACAFVDAVHRHHRRPQGHKFSLGVLDATGRRVGVAIVGRPVSRHLDDGWTLEVTRCATDGTANACSALYAAAWRTARSSGHRRLITYTQAGESGASLRAAGAVLAFAQDLAADPGLVEAARRDLTGDLACWCPLSKAEAITCHGDVLLRVVAGTDPVDLLAQLGERADQH